MPIQAIFDDKSRKQKAKTAALGVLVLEGALRPEALIAFAAAANDTDKATCIESLEYATKKEPGIATEACLAFVTDALGGGLCARRDPEAEDGAQRSAAARHRGPG